MNESDVEAAMQSAQGAVGSTEAPPRYSCGIENHEALIALEEKDARIGTLEACNAALAKALATNLRALNALLATFTADQPDLPDPPRRPDGTLMPQPKALTVPRETGDKRRIGG